VTVATLVTKSKEATLTPKERPGGICVWQEDGVRRRFCVRGFGRNLASVTMMVFSNLIYFIKDIL
jgi:hypothetical protein